MSTIKVYDWDEWYNLCAEYAVNPYEYFDFSIGVPSHRQISGGDTIDFEFIGEIPKEKE